MCTKTELFTPSINDDGCIFSTTLQTGVCVYELEGANKEFEGHDQYIVIAC